MCYTLAGRAAYCRCTARLSDNTLVRMCDVALMYNRTPCNMVSFLSPEESSSDPTCPRCSHEGHITIFINPSATRRTPKGHRDEYHVKDIHEELKFQLLAAAQTPLASPVSPAPVKDKALTEALKDATDFIEVQYSDGEEQSEEEQFDDEEIPGPVLDRNDDINYFSARSSSPTRPSRQYGITCARLLFGR